MRNRLWAGSLLVLAAAGPPAAHAGEMPRPDADEQQALFERARARQQAFEQSELVKAGFEPLDAIASDRRSVRQAWFMAWLPGEQPGVQIERLPGGKVTVTIVGASGTAAPVGVPSKTWTHLGRLEHKVFAARRYVPRRHTGSAEKPPPPPVCHGEIVRMGMADPGRWSTASWAACGRTAGPELAWAAELARVAVATQAACTFDADAPFSSFRTCFAARPR